MGRGIAIALALSLAANVFLGGFVVGRLAAPKPPVGGAAPVAARGFSEPAKAAMERAYQARRGEVRERALALRAAFVDLRDVLEAEDFDPDAAAAAFARLREARLGAQTLQEEIFIAGAKNLSAEDRRGLAADLAERRRGAGRLLRQRRGVPQDEPPADF